MHQWLAAKEELYFRDESDEDKDQLELKRWKGSSEKKSRSGDIRLLLVMELSRMFISNLWGLWNGQSHDQIIMRFLVNVVL